MTARVLLIVDDSRSSRLATKIVPKAVRPDWEFIFCESGKDALAKVHPELTDLDGMLLDLNMPGVDGLELAGELRALYPEAPSALLTANIQRRIKERAHQAGCLFIGKPVSEEKLLPFLEQISGS